MSKIEQFEEKVRSLAVQLQDDTDKAWLVGTYVSLRTAQELGYQRDDFAKAPAKDRKYTLQCVISENLLDVPNPSSLKKSWKAGYFFNNALLRMVALAEIGLKLLFEKRTGKKPPPNYHCLVEWYELNFDDKLDYVGKARQQVNRYKHKPRDPTERRKLETLEEGVLAFDEILSLMSRLTLPNKPMQLTR